MDIFSAVIFDGRSIVPASVNTFTTLKEAKAFIMGTIPRDMEQPTRWEEWDEGGWVFGYGTENIDEPIGAVYGSELEGAQQ
jgi:hypothetical protein